MSNEPLPDALPAPVFDPAKSDHISLVRQAATQLVDAIRQLVDLGELREDRGYNPPAGDNMITQADFVGTNASAKLEDFFVALIALGELSSYFTPEMRRALNRIRV